MSQPAKQFGISWHARAQRSGLVPLLVALLAAFPFAVAPAANAAQKRALLPDATVKLLSHKPHRSGVIAPVGRRSIPLFSPDPAQLREAKAKAAARLARRSLLSPSTSPAPAAAIFGGLNSAGMSAGGSETPPDTTGAIGPSNYLEFVNDTGITAYNRSLSPVSGPVGLEDFIGYPSDFVFDPQIQWDDNWGRWIYVMDDIEEAEEEIEEGVFELVTRNYLAFGWSKTADPTNLSSAGGGWCGYFLYTGSEFDDYPKLGHGNSGITIGSNVFDLETGEFLTARIWSVSKPPSPGTCPEWEAFEPGSGLTVGAFGSLAEPLETADGDTVFTPVPANTADSSSASYVVAADSPYFTPDAQIMGWHVNGGGEGATLVEDGNMNVEPFEMPANVPQPGTSKVIDSSDARLTNAVAANDAAAGQEAVWTQHTVEGSGGRSEVRWYELLPGTQTVRQQGTVSDPAQFVFNGAISPTRQGDAAAIDFNRGSSTLTPDMHAQSRDASTPLGQMQKDVLLGVSTGAAQDFSCVSASEPCRWGDYAGASPDPSVSGVVWGSSQGLATPSGSNARWTTRNFALLTDVTAPAAPTVSSVSPASPANDNSPKIGGTAEAGSTVKLYANASCTGAPTATGSAADFASPGIAVSVSDDSETTFYATATDAAENTSACSSSSVTYKEDSTPPGAPTVSSTSPASPANDNSPKVIGNAEAESTVRLYAAFGCTGAVAGTGDAATFASVGIGVAVSDDSTTAFYATATDSAGNTSSCSAIPVVYVEDSTPPGAPTVSSVTPASPANDNAPKVKGTAGIGFMVKLYANASCSGAPVATGTAAEFAFGGITAPVADNSVTTFYATATDAAENTSACSSSSAEYVEDSTAPDTTIDSGPSGTTSDSTPTFAFSSNEPSATFQCKIDAGSFASCSSPFTAPALADGSHGFLVRATDAAGNVDASPASRGFTIDTTAPPPSAPPPTAASAGPSGPSPACLKAKRALKKAKKQLKAARTAAQKKKAKKAIKKAKWAIKKYC